MKYKILFTALFLTSVLWAKGQHIYHISVAQRNAAITLTKKAEQAIKEKNYSQAYNDLMKSVGIDSIYKDTYIRFYQLGIVYPQKSDQIIEALNKAKRIYQEDDEFYFYCGEIYSLKEQYAKAIGEYSMAMKYAKVNGEDYYLVPYYYQNRGNLFLKLKHYQAALRDYDYLLKLDSASASGLTNRGITYYKLGEKSKACSDWEKAAKNGFEFANTYYEKYCKKQ